MNFRIEIERETDGRWLAEVPDLSGVMTYGKTRHEALHATRHPVIRQPPAQRGLCFWCFERLMIELAPDPRRD